MTFLAAPPAQRRLRTADAAAPSARSSLGAGSFLGTRQTEKQFQAEVIRYAKLMGWRHYHTLRSEGSPAGWPDLVSHQYPLHG